MTEHFFKRKNGREQASPQESSDSKIMKTTVATRYWKWGSRARGLFIAILVMQAIGLVAFGFEPRSFIEKHPGMSGPYWSFVALSGSLFVAIYICCLGMLRWRNAVPTSDQWRSLASMINLFILSQLNFVDRTLSQIMMIFFLVFILPVAVYYFIKILEDQTRNDLSQKIHPSLAERNVRCD